MLPAIIPIFPLPNVVLFPGVFLPLHVFEERYRAMTRDALAGDRIIGISLLQPGYEKDYEGRPPVYRIGCAGVISHAEELPDGRFNIVLHGLSKFAILEELPGGAYRRARVSMVSETLGPDGREALRLRRRAIEALLLQALRAVEVQIPRSLSDEDLIHALCQYLEFAPAERQALLETESATARADALTELLEMQVLMARHPAPGQGGVH